MLRLKKLATQQRQFPGNPLDQIGACNHGWICGFIPIGVTCAKKKESYDLWPLKRSMSLFRLKNCFWDTGNSSCNQFRMAKIVALGLVWAPIQNHCFLRMVKPGHAWWWKPHLPADDRSEVDKKVESVSHSCATRRCYQCWLTFLTFKHTFFQKMNPTVWKDLFDAKNSNQFWLNIYRPGQGSSRAPWSWRWRWRNIKALNDEEMISTWALRQDATILGKFAKQ